jgi:hypothetical protein
MGDLVEISHIVYSERVTAAVTVRESMSYSYSYNYRYSYSYGHSYSYTAAR